MKITIHKCFDTGYAPFGICYSWKKMRGISVAFGLIRINLHIGGN